MAYYSFVVHCSSGNHMTAAPPSPCRANHAGNRAPQRCDSSPASALKLELLRAQPTFPPLSLCLPVSRKKPRHFFFLGCCALSPSHRHLPYLSTSTASRVADSLRNIQATIDRRGRAGCFEERCSWSAWPWRRLRALGQGALYPGGLRMRYLRAVAAGTEAPR